MKKINRGVLIKSFVFFILLMLYFITQINFNNEFEIDNNYLILKQPTLIKKKECNITYVGENDIFIKGKITSKKIYKKKIVEKKIFIKNNKLFFYKKIFIYLGDLKEGKSLFAVFKNYDNNLTKFYQVKIGQYIDDIPVKIKENNYQYLILEYNSTILKIKKDYININKYIKDKNETKNH